MASETFEFTRARWSTDVTNSPLVACPQPQGHVISFIFQSGWGAPSIEIQSILVQDKNGTVIDTLVSDKWYLNPDLFPDFVSFPLSTTERPGFVVVQNGIGQKGVKQMSVLYADEQIWNGDVPMGTPDGPLFPIAVPLKVRDFQRPDIKTFRRTKSISFSAG
jgi:hypothetical protein